MQKMKITIMIRVFQLGGRICVDNNAVPPKSGLVILITLFSLLLALNCVAQVSNNYFERIAMVSDGRLTRFTESPIAVYVEGLAVQGKEYAPDLQYALKEWEKYSGGILKFRLVDLPDGADILVSWVRELESSDQEHPLGISELQRTGPNEFRVEISVVLKHKKTHKPLTHEQMKTVLLHEFGHAVGLWGHSKDKEDLMYYAANAPHPTRRDINTIKQVYSHENGYSLHAQSIKIIKQEMRSKLENARLYFLLGTVYADQEDYSLAIDNFKRSLNLDSQFHKASSALALAYQSSGQEQAALTEYLSLAESDPSAAIHNMIGTLYFQKEDAGKAIQHFKKALELERTYGPAKKNLGEVYIYRGKEFVNARLYQEAIDLLLEAIDLFPDRPELHDTLGTAYTGAEQYQKAIGEYRKALQINPAFTPARTNMVSCYNNQGVKYAKQRLWDKAIESYTQALRLAPDMTEAEKNLSAAYWNQASGLSKSGKNIEAIKAYQRYLKREPNSKEAYNNLGAIYFRMDDYRATITAFRRALDMDPGDRGLRDNLVIAYHRSGIVLFQKGAYSQAAEEFRNGLKINPDNVGLHLGLAQALQRLKKWADAADHVNRVLTLDPSNDIAHKVMMGLNIQQGNELLQAKKYDEALAYYKRAPDELAPPSLHNSIGYIYIMKEKYLEAMDEFDRVLAAEPRNKIAHQNLVIVEGRLKQALSRSSNFQPAKTRLARARLSLAMSHLGIGNLTEAKKVLGTAVDLNPQDRNLRRSLTEGCKKLATAFRKEKNGQKEALELINWATQLR